ncbi:hypothetical protein, partial [Xanthomonas euvesicatoria]
MLDDQDLYDFNCSALSNPAQRLLLLQDASALSKDDCASVGSPYDVKGKLSQYLARSRSAVERLAEPVKVGVVFAMWNEVDRLMPASSTNPHGEDCLRAKIEALDWL